MTPPVIINARQAGPAQCSSTAATSNVAPISAMTLASSSTATYFGPSASTACSGAGVWLPDLASSFAPARETRSSAVSALAHNPANSASAAAARISQPIACLSWRAGSPGRPGNPGGPGGPGRRGDSGRAPVFGRTAVCGPGGSAAVPAALGPPGRQQPVLQAEHGSMLLGVGMVIPEQVQDAVGGEQVDFVRNGMLSPPGGRGGHLRADHHIS